MVRIPSTVLRGAIALGALVFFFFGLGFWLRAPWALAHWPWPDGPLSYLFIASILIAEGATMAWVAVTLELRAARGGALGLAAMSTGIVVTMGSLYTQRGEGLLLGWALFWTVITLGALGLWAIGPRYPLRDSRPTPRIVRGSFLVFALALGIATTMLLFRAPVVFPWPLKPESSTMFGCFFLASAIYFFDGWLRPSAANATGQLLGFGLYDLVLLPRYLEHWPKTQGGFRVSLAIYLGVLIWSLLLAIWYFGVWRRKTNPSVA